MAGSRRLRLNCRASIHAALLAVLALPVSVLAAIPAGMGFFVTADGISININYAVKSPHALALLNGIPGTRNKLAKPSAKRFADISHLAPTVEKATAAVIVDTNRLIEDEQAKEREQQDRLRRARAEHEARRTEATRKLETEQARQREISRLRTTVMNLEQRDSFLHHDVVSTRQQLGSISRDPADHSAVAGRSELERQLNYQQLQLDQTTTSKDDAMRRLEQLRIR